MYGEVTTTVQVLVKLGEVPFPGATNFVASEHFTEPKFFLSDNFRAWMLPKVEDKVNPSVLTCGRLVQTTKDVVIIASIGGDEKAETCLAEISYLISFQSNGEEGVLLTNGWGNIFFVEDSNGVLRTVNVYWNGGQWNLEDYPTLIPRVWLARRQVFSRNLTV